MAKSLEQIRNEVAKDNGFKDWNHLIYAWAGLYDEIQPFEDEVAKRYAIEAVKADRERVSKEAHIMFESDNGEIQETYKTFRVRGGLLFAHRESILDLKIELPK